MQAYELIVILCKMMRNIEEIASFVKVSLEEFTPDNERMSCSVDLELSLLVGYGPCRKITEVFLEYIY